MKYYKVKITSCKWKNNIWYANKIGQEFLVTSSKSMGYRYKVSDALYINEIHCDIISEFDEYGNEKVSISEKEKKRTEKVNKIKHYISKGKTTREVAKILKVSLATIGIAVHGNN